MPATDFCGRLPEKTCSPAVPDVPVFFVWGQGDSHVAAPPSRAGPGPEGRGRPSQRALKSEPRMPRTIRRPVVPFNSLITASCSADPKVSCDTRFDEERGTRVPV